MPTRYYGVQNEVKAYCNRLQNETSITVTPSILKTLNDRVESLKDTGVWSQYCLGFNDTDADSYISRANVNDVIGRSEVIWFTKGMKSIGLWSNMVSWPLRSYQNIGSGSTVYSLGGQGTYNATIYNTAEWNINGIRVVDSTSNGYIATTFKVVTTNDFPITMYTVNRKNGAGISNFRTLGQIGNSSNIINILRSGATSTDGYRMSVTGMTDINVTNLTLGISYPIYSVIDGNRVLFNVNLGNTTTNTPTLSSFTTTNTLNFSTSSPTGSGDNIQSILMLILNREANLQLINSLYKNTLGNGLGLS